MKEGINMEEVRSGRKHEKKEQKGRKNGGRKERKDGRKHSKKEEMEKAKDEGERNEDQR